MTRRCSGCAIDKPAEAFALDRMRARGRQSYCRACAAAAVRRHRDKLRAQQQAVAAAAPTSPRDGRGPAAS